MGAVKDTVHNLMAMLDSGIEEAKSWVDTMHELHSYLEAESKTVIHESLDRLLSRIRVEADNLIGGSARVLISPEGRVTVGSTYSDENSDPWLKRLKSQDFSILTPSQFSYFIQQLKSEVAQGNLIPVIEFLRANTKLEWTPVYLPTLGTKESEQPREPSSSSEWKLPGWLPAFPWEGPPLPRGLFKD
jgi:hypothetical protein